MNIYFSVLQNILNTYYQKNKITLVNLVLESLTDGIFSERPFYVRVSQVNLGKKQLPLLRPPWHQGILHSIRTEQNIGQSTSGMSSACRNNQPCRQRKSSINYKHKFLLKRTATASSLDSHTIPAERGLLLQGPRPACLRHRGLQWLFNEHVPRSLVCERVLGGCSMGLTLLFPLFFVIKLQTVGILLGTYQTNL